ncbi:MAG: glycosyltransferase family 39 protein [Sulfuriferula sp.]
MSAKITFQRVLWATLLIKLTLAFFLPMSGDEAYFIVWARHLDYGYYDHPPMVGWLLYGMRWFGDSEVLMRLPAVVFSTLMGVGIYRLLKPWDAERAAWVAIVFLISPINILNVLITTDTPLIFFAFVSVYMLVRAVQQDKLFYYALSGLALGLAFLSKYFAVLLGVAYLFFVLFTPGLKRRWLGLAVLVLAAMPAVAVNVYWNYTHCWDNILFNLYNRNEGAQFSLNNVWLYVVTTLYLMTPPLIYYAWQQRRQAIDASKVRRLYGFVFWLPIAIFALLSLKKTIGLHWVLAFYPFFYLWLAAKLTAVQWAKTAKFMAWFAAVHLLVVVAILAAPSSWWQHSKAYSGYVQLMHTDEVLAQLQPYQRDYLMAVDDYSNAAVMTYHANQEFFVFGAGSHHARQDDMNTDFRTLAGKNILTIDKSLPDLAKFTPYFVQVEMRTVQVRGAKFYLVLGRGFDYSAYRAGVLTEVRDRYYRIPDFLPHASCYFCDKYFTDGACPR